MFKYEIPGSFTSVMRSQDAATTFAFTVAMAFISMEETVSGNAFIMTEGGRMTVSAAISTSV